MEILIGLGIVLFLGWLIPSPVSWFTRRKIRKENRSLKEHLHIKMEIDADGMTKLQTENEKLKKMNENLRVSNQTLRNKPGRSELRLLHVYDRAVNIMLAKAPGFAPSWQTVIAHVEKEMKHTDQGMTAFVKRVFRPSGNLEDLSTQSITRLNNQNIDQR